MRLVFGMYETTVAFFRTMSRRAKTCSLWLFCLLSFPAMAQVTPPPRQDTQSPDGVSFRSGAYSYEEADLSIGEGDFPGGMVLKRIYNSATNGAGGMLPRGWTWNITGYVKGVPQPHDPDDLALPPNRTPYTYNVVFGGKSVGFIGGSRYSSTTSTGGPVGTYRPVIPSGASLVFNGVDTSGYYTFTDADGTIVNFKPYAIGTIANWTFPDGTILDFSNPNLITSNRGYAMIFESSSKICVVNLAQYYVTTGSTCPADAASETLTYDTSPNYVLTSVTKAGQTTTYGYNDAGHLNCITEPGQSTCRISTQYATCPPDPAHGYADPSLRMNDNVTSQQEASGNVISYGYAFDSCKRFPGQPGYSANDYRPFIQNTSTMSDSLGQVTTVVTNQVAMPLSIKNPLGNTKTISYNDNSILPNEVTQVSYIQQPEGNLDIYAYDGRGNITTRTVRAKPGSGASDLIWQAAFPATCATIKTCNKPDYVIDANGGRTDYTYDPAHGGVLTETAPADANGVRAVKRYGYGQRYAWIMNAGGTYSHASSPVWVRTEMRICATSATVSGACAAGPGDEVVTTYDYGPDTGAVGNNLWLRGIAVTSGGVTRRTCYGYDAQANKVSETSARAGLTVCP